MDVEVEVRRLPACKVELHVKASSSLVAKAHRQAIKKVNKEVTFPGFRKGKAPQDMVLKKYGPFVEREWQKCIADAAYVEAQRKARLTVLNTGNPVGFDLKSHSMDGAELVFSFETEPVVPNVDLNGYQRSGEEPKKVEEKQIEEAILQSRYYFAEWEPLDRGAEEGDTITIDLDTLENEPQRVFNGVHFEVSGERMAQWMKDLVIGAKAGDVLEGISEGGEMEPKRVKVTIKKVEKALLPELNDEFAKKMGVSDVGSLRETVRMMLQRNLDAASRDKEREKVNDHLMASYNFELPLSLIQTEHAHRLAQAEKQRGELDEEEKKKLSEKIFAEASQSVKLFYLARQIVREAKIPVSHSEVEHEATQFARGQNVDPSHLPKELFALALSKILLIKAQDYLIEHGKLLDPQETQKV